MSSAATPPPAVAPAWRRWSRRVGLLLAALALLVAAAWWGVPALLKSQLPPRLGEALGRPVSLVDARFDPWAMAVELQGLRIGAAPGSTAAPDAPPQLLIDRLHLDLNLPMALRHRAPVVDALTIDGLQLRLARTGAGRFDIDDLIARFSPAPAAQPAGEPARFALYNLMLRNGSVRFDDQPVARVHEIQALSLGLPFLSNLPGDTVIHTQPRLAFQLNGTAFDTGSQALPFAETRSADLRLQFQDLDLAPWLPYLPASLPVRLQRGRLSSDLQLHFVAPPQRQPTVALKGRVGLRDIAITGPGDAPLAAWQALSLELRDVQPLARQVSLGPLQIDGLVLEVARDARGRVNLLQLQAAGDTATPAAASAASAASAATTPPAAGWQLSLAGIQLQDALLRWRDASLRPAADYTLAGLSLQLQDIRWPAPDPVPVALKARLHRGAAAAGAPVAILAIDGTANHLQAALTTTLDGLDLDALAPYTAVVLQPRLRGQLAARAQLRWAAEPAALSLQLDEATLQNLQLQAGSGRQATRLAGLKSLQLADARIDLLARQVAVGRLRIDQPSAQLARLADGQIDLSAWLPRPAAGAAAAASPAPTAARAAADPDWRLSLQTLAVQGGRLAWTDAAVATDGQPLRAELSGLALQWQGLAWPATAKTPPSRLRLSAQVGAPSQAGAVVAPGRIDWNGRVGLAPLLADGRLQLDRLPVHLFMPYAGDALPATLLHADASLALQLRARSTPAGLQLTSDGDLQITELMLHTRPGPGEAAGSPLLSWESLALQGVSVTLQPSTRPQIVVRDLALSDFYSRLVITEQGRFNLQDIAVAEPAAAANPSPAASAPADPGLPIDLALGQTTLRNGRIDFSDRFVRPNYSARLTELNGTISALRSGTREMATISLRGRAADTALLDISGQLNPMVQPLALDIRAKATDLELAPLSPYAGKYAGYAIERGKLSMDVAYRIDADGKLDAKNQVVLNQLTFGERVESPSATQLPVLLAVALLKDRNGVIDINLPVSGSVSDPQFSVGAIIWKVIVNLLGKALTAPFSLLAGGGTDDLSQVQFAPGTARITDAGRAALDKVATALLERPSLTMAVTGAADTVSERDDARRSLLEERLAAEARRDRTRSAAPAPAAAAPVAASSAASAAAALPAAPLTAAERAAALKRLYQLTPLPDRPRNLINQLKDIPPAEMETRLLAGIPINDDTMRALALQRGLAVRDALIAKGLPSERLFLAAPKLRLSGEGDAAWVPMVGLSLSTAR